MPVLSTLGAMSAAGFGRIKLSRSVELASGALVNGQSNLKQINASDYVNPGDTLVIPSNFWVWSDNTSVAALTIDVENITIENNGKIIGKGGNGGHSGSQNTNPTNPTAGGPAIKINSGVNGVVIVNGSGAYIAGGGGGGGSFRWGGGGGGAGGGVGGNSGPRHTTLSGGTGGILNASGGNGGSWGSPYIDYNYSGSDGGSGDPRAFGGGAGGGGGSNIDTGSSDNCYMGTGGGGGRILPGTGGNGGDRAGYARLSGREGGDGGSAGNVGGNGRDAYGNEDGAGGGGGWGASGGTAAGQLAKVGAAGGKAVEDNGNAYTLTNNGTIYGATT